MELKDWISIVANDQWAIYIKRLSANDTGATSGHQAGIYIPKSVMGEIFPTLDTQSSPNPDCYFKASVDSASLPEQTLRAIYYNQKTRDEKRITRWKLGAADTPFQDTDNTGSIAILAFSIQHAGDSEYMRSWVCRSLEEEIYLEERIGEIEPQFTYFDKGNIIFEGANAAVQITAAPYPPEWDNEFPSGSTIISYLFKNQFHRNLDIDNRIIQRRLHEFNLFKLVEKQHVLPLIKDGFNDVEDFIRIANSVSNRRKSRSGKSLELHLESIFVEEGLTKFGAQCKTEGNKKPDFLFPDCASYHDLEYPSDKLRLLAVKTTVKDRWRQILNEANRIETSYLFTIQEGVSENQFDEMVEEKVQLVVPEPIHKRYPASIRSQIYTLSKFILETKAMTC